MKWFAHLYQLMAVEIELIRSIPSMWRNLPFQMLSVKIAKVFVLINSNKEHFTLNAFSSWQHLRE
jgi:hypothetical protein